MIRHKAEKRKADILAFWLIYRHNNYNNAKDTFVRAVTPMEILITADTIIQAAAVLTALGVIVGAVVACVKFIGRQKALAKEQAEIRAELTVICYAQLACLKGLREQGCNGPVTDALNRLEKHLNKAAHHIDELLEP